MKNREKFAIIADDYTGAGDSGVHFSRAGRQTDLLLQGENLAELLRRSSGVSLTTESRFMHPAAAAATVATVIGECRKAGYTQFYKKIDSTARGNPGAEIESALDSTGLAAALICTAMPKTGRTCVDGKIYVDGIPLHMTEIGHDPFNPLSTSSVAELLAQQTALPIGTVSVDDIRAGETLLAERLTALVGQGVRLIIADAATESHLLALAMQTDVNRFLPVGAGGFAKALAAVWQNDGRDVQESSGPRPQGPLLAVIGSLAGISREQADLACSRGYFQPFDILPEYDTEEIEKAFSLFISSMGSSTQNILLRVSGTVRPGEVTKEDGERIAQLLGKATALICRRYRCRAVFSTGGSTSMGVARALGIKGVTLISEIMPGVVLGSCSAPDTVIEWFISKAGGFGDKELLINIAAMYGDSNKGV